MANAWFALRRGVSKGADEPSMWIQGGSASARRSPLVGSSSTWPPMCAKSRPSSKAAVVRPAPDGQCNVAGDHGPNASAERSNYGRHRPRALASVCVRTQFVAEGWDEARRGT